MRPISRKLFSILYSGELKAIQFLDLQLIGQVAADTLHFTDGGQPVVWRGVTYQPISMKRGKLSEKIANQSGTIPSLEMMIGNIDRQMAGILSRTNLDGAMATLYLADRRLLSNGRDATVITFGEIQSPVLSETTLTFQVVTVIGQQEQITIPRRVYQSYCNYVFGANPHCGVDINHGLDSNNRPIQYTSTLAAGTTERFLIIPNSILTDALLPDDVNDFFAGGYIVITNGQLGLLDRPIQRIDTLASDIRVWLTYPLPAAPAAGDGVLVRRNCKLTKQDCMLYHNGDPSQFGGYTEVPPVRFKPTKVNQPG